MAESDVILSTRGLTMKFGGLVAVNDFNLDVKRGELLGLIGPNGAGKTTVFNVITGQYMPTAGRVVFGGRDITAWKPNAVASHGVARTFQNVRVFQGLSVLENVLVSHRVRMRSSFFEAVVHTRRFVSEERAARAEAMALLERLGLAPCWKDEAASLPYGQQRRLEMARALATKPSLLLLDEPAAGMNPEETSELMRFIQRIRDEFSLTVFLIEHDMHLVMGICERIRVLDYGISIAEGTAAEIQADPRVIEAYLGEEEREEATGEEAAQDALD